MSVKLKHMGLSVPEIARGVDSHAPIRQSAMTLDGPVIAGTAFQSDFVISASLAGAPAFINLFGPAPAGGLKEKLADIRKLMHRIVPREPLVVTVTVASVLGFAEGDAIAYETDSEEYPGVIMEVNVGTSQLVISTNSPKLTTGSDIIEPNTTPVAVQSVISVDDIDYTKADHLIVTTKTADLLSTGVTPAVLGEILTFGPTGVENEGYVIDVGATWVHIIADEFIQDGDNVISVNNPAPTGIDMGVEDTGYDDLGVALTLLGYVNENYMYLILNGAEFPEMPIIIGMSQFDFNAAHDAAIKLSKNYTTGIMLNEAIPVVEVARVINEGRLCMYWNETHSDPTAGAFFIAPDGLDAAGGIFSVNYRKLPLSKTMVINAREVVDHEGNNRIAIDLIC